MSDQNSPPPIFDNWKQSELPKEGERFELSVKISDDGEYRLVALLSKNSTQHNGESASTSPFIVEFLTEVRDSGRRAVLVTNEKLRFSCDFSHKTELND